MNIEKISEVAAKTQLRISEHRLAVRFTILSRPINLITIVSIIPFFIGFYEFLNQNQQLKKILFKKNIPLFDIPTESMNWETFRYFSENKKDFLLGIEKVQWSPNSLFLTKTLNTECFDQEFFIASITNPGTYFLPSKTSTLTNSYQQKKLSNSSDSSYFLELDNTNDIQKFGSNRFYLKSFNKQSQFALTKTLWFSHILDNFYLNLDEIPLKLDNLTFISSNEKNTDNKTEKLIVSAQKNTSNNELFFPLDQQIPSTEINLPFEKEIWKKTIKKNSFFYGQCESIQKINSLEILTQPLTEIKYFPNNASQKLIPAISKFNSYQVSTKTGNINDKNFSFLSGNFGTEKYNLEKVLNRFNFSSFFSLPSQNDIQKFNLNIAEILLQKQIEIQKFQIEIDGVLLEKKDGVVRQMSGYSYPDMNSREVGRFLLHNLFSYFPKNFGLLDRNLTILKINLPANPAFNFRSFLNSKIAQLSPVDSRIPEVSLSKTLNFQDGDLKFYFYQDKNALLKFKHELPVTSTSTVDYFYSPDIFSKKQIEQFGSKTKIKPLSSSYGEFFNEELNTVNYKKLLSIFNKPQFFEKNFSDSWEPLTFRSWLIVSQVGFAFLIFNFLKSLFLEYFNELIWFLIDFSFALGALDENLKEEIEVLTGKRDKGFRVFPKTRKKFQDIAGIKTLLPEIAETVWFLRNRGKDFSLSKNFPRGLLLVGPPGTGKTFLVQALAGEAEVPVLALSGSSLVAPGESGALKLEILFQQARQLAPCIVFIDEIDTLAQKRQGVMQNPMGGDEILSALEPVNASLELSQSKDFLKNSETSFFTKSDQIGSLVTQSADFREDLNSSPSQKMALEIKQQIHAQEKFRQEQLTLLMQLLIELDGIQGRKGVVVIGATNRPELLDSAILRPGRFDKIVELGLPSHEKRFEIFKLYGELLGYDPNICWEYLSRRTVGFTAADLASIMNQSSLKAILNNTQHNLKTIEHGIDRITTSEIEKPTKKITNLFRNRVAYYQAGKILLSTILKYHPPTLVSYLWPRRQNRRSLQILSNLQKYFFQCARRCELEDRIVGCYGGKAAEILFLQNSSVSLSSFGLEDLSFAFVLICFIIEKWYLYSKSTLTSQLNQIISNKNSQELIPEKIEFFKELAYSMEFSPHLLYSHETDVATHPLSQNFFSNAWWQLNVSQELEFVEHNFADWYRLYLPNPEETELNIEWSPPDEFYHRNLLNKQVNKNSSVTWNDLHKIARDYQVHALVLQSFNKALSLLDDNREFLDKLVLELVKTEVLRQPEIEKIAASFIPFTPSKTKNSTSPIVSDIKIVNNSFGHMSRRKIKNWIDFKDFEIL